MKTEITSRHFDMSQDLKGRVEERLERLQRYFDRILDARVVVSLEKNRYNAEATIFANGTPLVSHALGESDKVALEQVLDKLEVQVRRYKDRLTRGKRRARQEVRMAAPAPVDSMEAAVAEGMFDENDLDGLISEDAGEFDVTMPVAEAAAQLRVSKREVLGFTNPVTNRPTVIYKRRDGNVGVVDIHLT